MTNGKPFRRNFAKDNELRVRSKLAGMQRVGDTA
jgi:hypothetical protein